jgi:hypothetical protein
MLRSQKDILLVPLAKTDSSAGKGLRSPIHGIPPVYIVPVMDDGIGIGLREKSVDASPNSGKMHFFSSTGIGVTLAGTSDGLAVPTGNGMRLCGWGGLERDFAAAFRATPRFAGF